ncbi:helix-turn-helix protein [Brevibacterium sanguinis]|uniref:Helix-turn-helix protein n=2 Tax=Brevibacterium TaxID=1696 RepID=A0A366IK96_9MICO|nr:MULTISPECIES: helix-turn-helix transcriptional regulator [Brevibacterium]RBP66206.1 helix-turn-helix protein [Brevibacterium sanguinis]RBP72857.1 helix-turn-helix protein [Brevibacterium celere]
MTGDDDFLQAFAQRLQRLRRKTGLPQEQVAFRSGLSVSTYSQLERGRMGINIKRLPELAGALDCDIVDLFTDHHIDRSGLTDETPATRAQRLTGRLD